MQDKIMLEFHQSNYLKCNKLIMCCTKWEKRDRLTLFILTVFLGNNKSVHF